MPIVTQNDTYSNFNYDKGPFHSLKYCYYWYRYTTTVQKFALLLVLPSQLLTVIMLKVKYVGFSARY